MPFSSVVPWRSKPTWSFGSSKSSGTLRLSLYDLVIAKNNNQRTAVPDCFAISSLLWALLKGSISRTYFLGEKVMKAAMSKRGTKRIRVGIIGANPDRGWAAQAHIPALKSLSDDFEITALSTSRRESADAASELFGVPVAFDNHKDLVNRADVDVVAITVKVPYHLELATAALDAGKAVYCEWPLGNGLKEAETLATLAEAKSVLAVAGGAGPASPAVGFLSGPVQQ